MTPKIQSGKSISVAFASFAWFIILAIVVNLAPIAKGQSPAGTTDQFQSSVPVMTFLDMYSGQPWGRYVVSETVTVPKYEYREVKDKVWVPTWVQEPKPTTTTQYDPIVSYQLRPRSVPSANPFAPPQQIVEYVPIVQYQPRNVQTTQMTAYQKYEEREVSRMVPVLVNASEQRQRFVDRPLSASGTPAVASSNLIQDSAMLAQASRTTARYPTRSIDYPSKPTYGSPVYGYTSANSTWNAPVVLTPPAPPATATQYAASPYAGSPYASFPYAASQYTARQAATAPIVPIATQASVPATPPVYAGTGTPIPPPSGPPTLPYAYPPNTYAQPSYTPAPPASYAYPTVPLSYPAPNYAAGGYPAPAYPAPSYAASPYPQAGYPQAGYPPMNYGYPPSAYPAWYARQGTLFPTTLFGTSGGQSSLVSGGYPYTGYPPGAVPPPTTGYGYGTTGYSAPRMATNPMGVSSNAPNYWGRNTLPFATGSY